MEIKRKYFTKEQRNIAAKVDIRDYLNDVHPNLIREEGDRYARYLGKRSVSLSVWGYVDNSTGEAGNCIDFLTTYLFDGNLVEAVLELYAYAIKKKATTSIVSNDAEGGFDAATAAASDEAEDVGHALLMNDSVDEQYRLPDISSEPERLVAAHRYLERHGITVDFAVADSIHAARYPDEDANLILFKSRETNYSLLKLADEGHGVFDYTDIPLPTSDNDGYYIIGSMVPHTVYVCEGILAALSLRELRRDSEGSRNEAYASIARETNRSAINRLSHTYPNAKIIVAFDNDDSGLKYALKAPYDFIKPQSPYINWNQQLLSSAKEK